MKNANEITIKGPELGFGFLRLPRINGSIDIEYVKTMVDVFMKSGFSYFDTAWAYQGSEEAIRASLVERYPRKSYRVATKVTAWTDCRNQEDIRRQFQTSLQRTGLSYFDYYLLHSLGEFRTAYYDEFGAWDFIVKMKAEGRIGHIGFLFHGTADELEKILSCHPEIEFVQLQINYADWENDKIQSKQNYEIARKYKKDIIVMEPVKGGMLDTPPKRIQNIMKKYRSDMSIASWALRFAASLDGVIIVLSGMSTLEQVKDNVQTIKNFLPLEREEYDILGQARNIIKSSPVLPCTGCNYCSNVCPKNIGISGTFQAWNYYLIYGNAIAARNREDWLVKDHNKESATICIKCGKCEEVCPQKIEIRKELVNVRKNLLEC